MCDANFNKSLHYRHHNPASTELKAQLNKCVANKEVGLQLRN